MWEVRRSSPAPMQLRVSILKPKFGSPLTSRRYICSTRSQETGCPMVLQFPRSVKIFLKSEPVWALCASGGSLDILPRGSVITESPPALRARQEIRCTFCCRSPEGRSGGGGPSGAAPRSRCYAPPSPPPASPSTAPPPPPHQHATF